MYALHDVCELRRQIKRLRTKTFKYLRNPKIEQVEIFKTFHITNTHIVNKEQVCYRVKFAV